MKNKTSATVLAALAVMTLSLDLTTVARATNTLNVVHAFTGSPDGSQPNGGLTKDSSGNLYGTTVAGGVNGTGTVFELSPNGSHGWRYAVIYSFSNSGPDGQEPMGGVTLDNQGNIYGTTNQGAYGYGAVWEISPSSNGTWTLANFYSFSAGSDGGNPTGPVLLDFAGNIYGTASQYGNGGAGTVFEITTYRGWNFQTIYSFYGDRNGGIPVGGVTMDRNGNLYYAARAIFQLHPSSIGWIENPVYLFDNRNDAAPPEATPILDSAGNLYGTAWAGPGSGPGGRWGGIYKLSPSGILWLANWLYYFPSNGHFGPGLNGAQPNGSLLFDSAGDLYGETPLGGMYDYGVIYKLSYPQWTESVLWNFTGGDDGCNPTGQTLLSDATGNLYGTTQYCGANLNGVVFELVRQ